MKWSAGQPALPEGAGRTLVQSFHGETFPCGHVALLSVSQLAGY